MKKLVMVFMFVALALCANAKRVNSIVFCDKKYEYAPGKDSISLFLKVLDSDNQRADITIDELKNSLKIFEDDTPIPDVQRVIRVIQSGQRIPADYTFSVLVDLSMPEDGKIQMFDAIGKLIESAPDSCVYLSFFGDEVTSSKLITKDNYAQTEPHFHEKASSKYFYGALYSKLIEFGDSYSSLDFEKEEHFQFNEDIRKRGALNKDKNFLLVFTEGSKRPEDEVIDFDVITEYQEDNPSILPKVYAFYYTGLGLDENIENMFKGVTCPRDSRGIILEEKHGKYLPSNDLSKVLETFEGVVQDAMYDYAFVYRAFENKVYSGKTEYLAKWDGDRIGNGVYSIGTVENPWPIPEETWGDTVTKYLIVFFMTLLTAIIFFCVMKILIPAIKSKTFAAKYYKPYEPEANVQRRICHYCKQDIQPGQMVVVKCKHIMHVHCWQQNGYKCAEYGQNCKTGIQEHVEWKDLLTRSSLRDFHPALAGICAALVSWIVFELTGRGSFKEMASAIVNTFFVNQDQLSNLYDTCVTTVSAFLTIGVLLGFFLSLVFRYNDEYRKRDWKVYLKIVGLSILSGIIGMLAFAFGAMIFCLLLSVTKLTYIPWYCSLPAYLLFSICTALSFTIKSSVPVKSALLGGLCSSVIGFIVLYFSKFIGSTYGWLNMLLDFVIYGGGLGASLVTVRILAEKYFLVIQNGVKSGQRIPIHKWMNATGGGNKVSIGMTGECEIQMNWEKSNKVAKEHAQLFIDHAKSLPMIKPLATGVIFNTRAELPVGKASVLSNGDTFKIGDTIFQYVETE